MNRVLNLDYLPRFTGFTGLKKENKIMVEMDEESQTKFDRILTSTTASKEKLENVIQSFQEASTFTRFEVLCLFENMYTEQVQHIPQEIESLSFLITNTHSDETARYSLLENENTAYFEPKRSKKKKYQKRRK